MSFKLECCLLNLEFIFVYIFYTASCTGTVIEDFKCCNSTNGSRIMTRCKIWESNFDLYDIFNFGLLMGNSGENCHPNDIIITLKFSCFPVLLCLLHKLNSSLTFLYWNQWTWCITRFSENKKYYSMESIIFSSVKHNIFLWRHYLNI